MLALRRLWIRNLKFTGVLCSVKFKGADIQAICQLSEPMGHDQHPQTTMDVAGNGVIMKLDEPE